MQIKSCLPSQRIKEEVYSDLFHINIRSLGLRKHIKNNALVKFRPLTCTLYLKLYCWNLDSLAAPDRCYLTSPNTKLKVIDNKCSCLSKDKHRNMAITKVSREEKDKLNRRGLSLVGKYLPDLSYSILRAILFTKTDKKRLLKM